MCGYGQLGMSVQDSTDSLPLLLWEVDCFLRRTPAVSLWERRTALRVLEMQSDGYRDVEIREELGLTAGELHRSKVLLRDWAHTLAT